MNDSIDSLHRASLTVSASEVYPGYTAHLHWKVVGVKANIASVHLACCVDDGPSVIEAILPEGSRDLILTEAGMFAFTLTATFGDGIRLSREALIRVTTNQ